MSLSRIQRPEVTLTGAPSGLLLAHIAQKVAPRALGENYQPYEPITFLTSAARTTNTQSTWVVTPSWAKGLVVELECTLAAGAGSIKPRIYGRRSNAVFANRIVCDDTVGLAAATGIRTICIWSGGGVTFWDKAENQPLYPEVSVLITHATADSYTYNVQAWFVP